MISGSEKRRYRKGFTSRSVSGPPRLNRRTPSFISLMAAPSCVPVLLSAFDKSARVFDRRWRKNTVAQIQDVPEGSGLFKYVPRSLHDAFFRTEQNTGIKIPLKRHSTADAPARFNDRYSPINADHFRSGARHRFQYGGAAIQIKDARNSSAY